VHFKGTNPAKGGAIVVAQFIPLLSRRRRDKGGDWAFWKLDKSSNYNQETFSELSV
jgi:hypothetical protein